MDQAAALEYRSGVLLKIRHPQTGKRQICNKASGVYDTIIYDMNSSCFFHKLDSYFRLLFKRCKANSSATSIFTDLTYQVTV